MGTAVERIVSASQQLVADRLELLLLDGKQALIGGLQAAAAAAIAIVALSCGWLCVNAALAASLHERLPMVAILGVLVAINVAIGAIAGVAALSLVKPRKNTGK